MARKDVQIIRGTTNTFSITLTDANGKIYNLTSSEKLLFGVKKKYTDEEYLILKKVTGVANVYTVTIDPADTADLECGTYFYDVSVESGNNFYNVIESSKFDVRENITKWGAS